MKKSLFKYIVDCVTDNNQINNAQWSDWDDAHDAIACYSDNYVGETDDKELELTVELIQLLIDSNGSKLKEAYARFNDRIWGFNWVDQEGITIV